MKLDRLFDVDPIVLYEAVGEDLAGKLEASPRRSAAMAAPLRQDSPRSSEPGSRFREQRATTLSAASSRLREEGSGWPERHSPLRTAKGQSPNSKLRQFHVCYNVRHEDLYTDNTA